MIEHMNRRKFATTLGVSAAAGFAPDLRLNAATGTSRTSCYLLESFRLQQGTQPARLDQYFTGAVLPALGQLKVAPVIILEAVIGPHTPEILAISGYTSLAAMSEMRDKLAADKTVAKALAQYESGPDPPYDSQQITLLEAASFSPEISEEKRDARRYFELRVYHSNSRAILHALHERFAGPETRIFARSGIHPVLYGNTVIGADVPNLTYLIPFDSLGARGKAWDTFNADPEWLKVREESKKNGQLVSVANVSIYRAAAYSPIK
jgi:hypothetical protein